MVFGIVWPLNFLALLGAGGWFTRSAAPIDVWPAISVLAVSVVAALAWAWLFYVPHRIGYAVWLSVATALSVQYSRLN